MAWNPGKTWNQIKKRPFQEIAKQGAAYFVGGPVGSVVAAAHTLGGKKEKSVIDKATFGAASAAEKIGKQAQKAVEAGANAVKDAVLPKLYKPGKVNFDRSPFETQANQSEIAQGFYQKADAASGRMAPAMTAAQIDSDPQTEFRARQLALAQQLSAQAEGQGPSLAEMQMKQNTDAAIRSAMALAASGRGGTAGGRLKAAMDSAAALQGQGARDAAALRIQEQMAAREQLAGLLGQGRSQDIGLATNQAQLIQGANQANLGANLSQTGMNDAAALAYSRLGYGAQREGITDAQLASKLDLERLLQLEELRRLGIASENQTKAAMISGIGQAAANAVPFL